MKWQIPDTKYKSSVETPQLTSYDIVVRGPFRRSGSDQGPRDFAVPRDALQFALAPCLALVAWDWSVVLPIDGSS